MPPSCPFAIVQFLQSHRLLQTIFTLKTVEFEISIDSRLFKLPLQIICGIHISQSHSAVDVHIANGDN